MHEMKRAHGGALLLIWGIGSGAFGTNACGEKLSCTEIGCVTGEELSFSMPPLTDDSLQVEACRNDQCWQEQLVPNGQRQFLSFGDDNFWVATLVIQPVPDSWSVTAAFPVMDYAQVVVGDVLKVTFSNADGKQLFTVSGTTRSFVDSYPNGPDCEPSPCRQGTAEITDP
jgi:hypothetical protein